jgi:hypothetical protein
VTPRGLASAADGKPGKDKDRMEVFCGIDWAENHHDIALAGRDGQLLARRRISDDPAGLAVLLELLAEHGDGLAAAGYTWAFAALTASPGARAHYDRRRQHNERHTAAQRNPCSRLLGCLHHCLTTRQPYDEATAFPPPAATPNPQPLDN